MRPYLFDRIFLAESSSILKPTQLVSIYVSKVLETCEKYQDPKFLIREPVGSCLADTKLSRNRRIDYTDSLFSVEGDDRKKVWKNNDPKQVV